MVGLTVLSYTRIDGRRDAKFIADGRGTLFAFVSDRRRMEVFGLKQDWTLERSSTMMLKWGFDLRRSYASYDYLNQRQFTTGFSDGDRITKIDSTTVLFNPDGTTSAGYIGVRTRPIDFVTMEVGLRLENSTWIPGRQWSPRVGIAFSISESTTARVGWGNYSQFQSLHQLAVEDGDAEFYSAERSTHWVIGIEHVFASGIQARVQAYHKKLGDLRPRYINLRDGAIDNNRFPEVEEDRFRIDASSGTSTGVEFF